MPADGKVFAITKKRRCLRFFVAAARLFCGVFEGEIDSSLFVNLNHFH